MQGGTGIAPAEIVKPHKPADVTQPPMPVASMPENQSEPSPPPSRILRSGKRVPIGTASKAPPRTASKASRAAVPEANEDLQVCLTIKAVAHILHKPSQPLFPTVKHKATVCFAGSWDTSSHSLSRSKTDACVSCVIKPRCWHQVIRCCQVS